MIEFNLHTLTVTYHPVEKQLTKACTHRITIDFQVSVLRQNAFYSKQNLPGSLTYKAGQSGAALTEAGGLGLKAHPAALKRPSLEHEVLE